jgi:hypothetical protein
MKHIFKQTIYFSIIKKENNFSRKIQIVLYENNNFDILYAFKLFDYYV